MSAFREHCADCHAALGELHAPGCDVERCPRCGCQAIGCDCLYEVCGLDLATLETEHPDIYENGPPDWMRAVFAIQWGDRRMPWEGEFPGTADCRRLGLWCRWEEGRGFIPCGAGTPGARADLGSLQRSCRWDVESQRWERRLVGVGGAGAARGGAR